MTPRTRNALSDLRSRETVELIHKMMGARIEATPEYLIDIVQKLHERVCILENEVVNLRATEATR